MLAAVIPAQNEAGRITRVLAHLRALDTDILLPVVNGSTDTTLTEILALGWPEIKIIYFPESLGIDVPRAVGAQRAKELGAQCVLFVDGDMIGDLHRPLRELIESIFSGTDLALTNCYPFFTSCSQLARLVFSFRRRLNRVCNLKRKLGLASPSHGPTAVSAAFLEQVPPEDMALPPVGMVRALQAGLEIQVATSVPHAHLGSANKDQCHAHLIADTIIGDCLEAMAIFKGTPPSRTYLAKDFRGYHPQRRWDILEQYLSQKRTSL